MSRTLTFVQSAAFTDFWQAFLDDDHLLALQHALLSEPSVGDPMPGCGVLRKLRIADPRRPGGKRGGYRVIYMHTPIAHRIDLIAVYPKSRTSGLRPDTVRALCRVARAIRRSLERGGNP
jgi:hypothetical protein